MYKLLFILFSFHIIESFPRNFGIDVGVHSIELHKYQIDTILTKKS